MIMLRIRFILCAVIVLYCSSSVFAITDEELMCKITCFTLQENTEIFNTIKSILARAKKHNDGDLDLNPEPKLHIFREFSCLRGDLKEGTVEYNTVQATWALILHYTLVDKKLRKENPETSQECSICEEEKESVISLLCHHQFCVECLLQSFAKKTAGTQGAHNQCALCRSDIGSNLKNFLKFHPQYDGIIARNIASDELEDYQNLMREQLEADEDSLRALEDYNALMFAQQQFDEEKSQSVLEDSLTLSVSDGSDSDTDDQDNSQDADGENQAEGQGDQDIYSSLGEYLIQVLTSFVNGDAE